jgi:RNA 2',3'-cyclic 3'-phosphodiesterase
MDEHFRAFIALPLPEAVTTTLSAAQAALVTVAEQHRIALRWTRPQHFHLTVKFLGQVPRRMQPVYAQLLSEVAERYSPMTATLQAVAVFGSTRRARVLHVGIHDPRSNLVQLASALDEAAEALGVERESRPYRPHVTLARFKRPGNAEPLLQTAALTEQAVHLDRLCLFESRPGRHGSEHIPLAEASLSAEVPQHGRDGE